MKLNYGCMVPFNTLLMLELQTCRPERHLKERREDGPQPVQKLRSILPPKRLHSRSPMWGSIRFQSFYNNLNATDPVAWKQAAGRGRFLC